MRWILLFLVLLPAIHGCSDREVIELQPGQKNTLTLPDGQVVWDLNGEWEAEVLDLNVVDGIVVMHQEGDEYVGTQMFATEIPKGYESFRIRLKGAEIVECQKRLMWGTDNCKATISDEGNTLVFPTYHG